MSRIEHKEYENYDAYVVHQVSKTKAILESTASIHALCEWTVVYRKALRESLGIYPFIGPGTSVLCLGARAGGEVKAFVDVGCFAVGIDLFPIPKSKYVLPGDFNNIQYAPESVDVVFTNSLDHTNDFDRTIMEVHTVLKPGGHFMVELVSDDTDCTDKWAACEWSSVQDVVMGIVDVGFDLESEQKLSTANHRLYGTQLCFRKVL
ncbi:MAG: class I SAM-dependent methyltransferase [Chloroflexi bacterium]|nr:class I SAM-dependent methyltransferase [Chloroflexota bacterium]